MIEYLKTYLWYVFDKDCFEVMCKTLLKTTSYGSVFCYNEDNDQNVEMLWSIMVLKFGDYGTSPTTGWIEKSNLSDAIEYIINELYTEGSENE